MTVTEIRLFAKNLISVCIDEAAGGDYRGTLLNPYEKDPIPFEGLADLVLKADALFDSWDFPQKAVKYRSFNRETEGQGRKKAQKDALRTINLATMNSVRGKLGTFVVQVQYRQNVSWQGQVIWTERNDKLHFRSALELIKIIDGALKGASDLGKSTHHGEVG